MTKRMLILAVLAIHMAGVALAQGFSGAGSTFAHPILARWGQAFSSLQGEGGGAVSVDGGFDYEPVGSLGGMMRATAGAVDFGATDVPLPPEDLARAGLLQFPFVTGGVAIVTNLAGLDAQPLRLSGQVLARIYLGEITRWNDAALVALNPGLALPDAAIAVLRREDGSGTTWHFAAFLAGVSPEWQSRVGVDTLLRWPVGTGVRGNAALAERVTTTRNAIAYVEASQAARLRLRPALLKNAAGRFVAPDAASLQAAAASAALDPARHFYRNATAPTSPDAYPITATVFALVPRNPASRGRARQTREFFRMALTERAGDAEALGYVPLPGPLVAQIVEYWRAPPR